MKDIKNLHHMAVSNPRPHEQIGRTVLVGICCFPYSVCTVGSCTFASGYLPGPESRRSCRSTRSGWFFFVRFAV